MGVVLTIKSVQSLVSVVCELTYLSETTESDSRGPTPEAQALFYLNIAFGVATVVYELLMLTLRGGILNGREVRERTASEAGRGQEAEGAGGGDIEDRGEDENGENDENDESGDEEEGDKESGTRARGDPRRTSAILEMTSLFKPEVSGSGDGEPGAEDDMVFTSNPLLDPEAAARVTSVRSEGNRVSASMSNMSALMSAPRISLPKRAAESDGSAGPQSQSIAPAKVGEADTSSDAAEEVQDTLSAGDREDSGASFSPGGCGDDGASPVSHHGSSEGSVTTTTTAEVQL